MTVSARALIIWLPMAGSFAQGGTRPQWRFLMCRSPSCWMIMTGYFLGGSHVVVGLDLERGWDGR